MSHTPLPWKVEKLDATSEPDVMAVFGPDGEHVASVWNLEWTLEMRGEPIDPTAAANARLISLAPEMADLLREMENYPECFICKRDPVDGHTPDCRLGTLLGRLHA